MTPLVAKHPSEALYIGVDFASRIPAGVTITGSSASLISGDVTVGASAYVGTIVTARVSAGTAGVASSISYSATLSNTEILYGIVDVTPMARDF